MESSIEEKRETSGYMYTKKKKGGRLDGERFFCGTSVFGMFVFKMFLQHFVALYDMIIQNIAI